MSRKNAEGGMASIGANSGEDGPYERTTSKAGGPYFVLTAANSQTIGKSEMYSSTSAMEGGIASCKTNGSSKEVKDETEPTPPCRRLLGAGHQEGAGHQNSSTRG